MDLPLLPPAFAWITAAGRPAIVCRPLAVVASHVFTSRHLTPEVAAEALGAGSRLWQLAQVHGNKVVVARGTAPAIREEADALVANESGAAIAVRAADCVPLLMADTRTGAVAAVHAGWRGTAAGIAVAALQALRQECGTEAADVVAAIGPSIAPCCYEVGPELVDAFAAAGHERYLIDRWFQVRRNRQLRLDVPGANRDQLVLAGVREEHVHLAGLCTAMHLDLLTSYRAEQAAAGRIAGVIRRA